jgi:hypothetical protein
MDGKLNTELIRQILNSSLDRLDQTTLTSLHDARLNAMNRFQAQSKSTVSFAWTGENAILHLSELRLGAVRWTGIIFLAASLLFGIAYWKQVTDDESNDDDISILTGDLPIQYYADQ